MSSGFAVLPKPPYYAVIFSARRRPGDQGYADMAERMLLLATQQPGFLGVENSHGDDGFGLTVSYWSSLKAIAAWKADIKHVAAQAQGKNTWYEHYEIRIARVERAYGKSEDAR